MLFESTGSISTFWWSFSFRYNYCTIRLN